MSAPTPSRLAVARAAAIVAPDDRVTVFDVEARTEDDGVVLEGAVETERARETVRRELARTPGIAVVRDDLLVLENDAAARTVGREAVPVRGAPNSEAEQVTQALYGAAATAYDARGGWRRVGTPDGYVGWVREDALEEPAAVGADSWEPDAAIRATPAAPVDGTDGVPDRLQAGTDCRLEAEEDGDVRVSFRTGERARLPADSVRSFAGAGPTDAAGTGEDVVAVAESFLGTPYEWGGMRADGIDCSGLVWVAYACAGVILPRDADQQEEIGAEIDREDLAPGDLLFFPGHVAISLGGAAYVHAYGTPGEVTVNSLDPDDDRYVESLDDSLRTTRRLL